MAEIWEEQWKERVGGFAEKVGKTIEEVEAALAPIIGAKSEQALEILADAEAAPVADIQAALKDLNIPSGVFKKNVNMLRGPKPEPTEAQAAAGVAAGAMAAGISYDILPAVPDDDSFTAMLKVGGDLKVGKTEVLSAVKAALAARVNLYDLPDQLKNRMEEFAEQIDEPVGKSFFDLRNLVVKRQYSEIFSALGIEGSFMSDTRKNRFLARLNEGLWEEIYAFHQMLVGWNENWMKNSGNPAIMMNFITAMMAGGGVGAMPAGMMQPPETDTIRDQAEAVVNRINKVFAGTGIPIARALAYDAQRIKEVLMDDRLPAAIGAPNREQMLKMLGVDVASDYVRLEKNLVRYILSVMELQNVTAGQTEITYIIAMLQLGNSIPWVKLLRISPPDGSVMDVGRDEPRKPGRGPKF